MLALRRRKEYNKKKKKKEKKKKKRNRNDQVLYIWAPLRGEPNQLNWNPSRRFDHFCNAAHGTCLDMKSPKVARYLPPPLAAAAVDVDVVKEEDE